MFAKAKHSRVFCPPSAAYEVSFITLTPGNQVMIGLKVLDSRMRQQRKVTHWLAVE